MADLSPYEELETALLAREVAETLPERPVDPAFDLAVTAAEKRIAALPLAQRVLDFTVAWLTHEQRKESYSEEIAQSFRASGHRIVNSGQDGLWGWEITDDDTGEVIAAKEYDEDTDIDMHREYCEASQPHFIHIDFITDMAYETIREPMGHGLDPHFANDLRDLIWDNPEAVQQVVDSILKP